MKIFFREYYRQKTNFFEKRRIFEEVKKGEPSVNEYIDTGKQKLIELKENIGEKINNGLQTLREKSSEYVDLVELSRMNNKEFLRKYSFEERISKITNPPVSYEDIQNGTVKNFDVSFAFGGVYNKELWLKTTAGQTFPTAIRKVKINDKEYSRNENALKGEFFAEDGERLKIHDKTNVEILETGNPEDIKASLNKQYLKYFEGEKTDEPRSGTLDSMVAQEVNPETAEERIVYMALEKGIDPKFVVIALGDTFSEGDDFDSTVVESYLTDFGREEEVYRKNKDKLGYGEDNLYNIHLAVTMMKKADAIDWKQKLRDYGYNPKEVEAYKFLGQVEIENVPESLRELMNYIAQYESGVTNNSYYALNKGESGDSLDELLPNNITIGEIIKRMDPSIKPENEEKKSSLYLHAVGKYQFTRDTFLEAVRFAGLSGDDVFTPENQEKMGIYLFIGGKRKNLAAYLTGKGGDLDNAHRDLAMEFSSVPLESGKSFYKDREINDGANKAQRIRSLLQKVRKHYESSQSLEKPYTELDKLDDNFRIKVENFMEEVKTEGLHIKITETWRSQERQNYLYAQGRTRKGARVTWTKNSNHTKGKAIDICFTDGEPYPNDHSKWEAIAKIARRNGMVWGYDKWGKDKPHFQDIDV